MTRKKNAGCPPDCLEPASRMADAVRSVIRTHFHKHMAVDAKADSSPVMIAAREAEAMMQRMIAEAFPEHGIPGEEFGAYQPDADWVWALDPIDSTKSFISGSLAFGTQIALLHQGVPVLGIVDRPIQRNAGLAEMGFQHCSMARQSVPARPHSSIMPSSTPPWNSLTARLERDSRSLPRMPFSPGCRMIVPALR